MAYRDIEARRQYINDYKKNNYKAIRVDLHKTEDADIIEHLATKKSRQGYIKELIRQDMKKQNG
jgi:hypothetical protein